MKTASTLNERRCQADIVSRRTGTFAASFDSARTEACNICTTVISHTAKKNNKRIGCVAVAKKADRTGYDVRRSSRIEPSISIKSAIG